MTMPDLLALQIEPSTFCTLRCPTCPRTAFAKHWHNIHFPLAKIDMVAPLAARAEIVLLQGWGEPLCHPEIDEIIRRLTEAGANCALTTNGCLLDDKRSEALLEAGLAHLTVSISGATPETHAALRPPSDLHALLERMRRFRQLAEKMGKKPRLTLSFLQQDANIHELPEVLALADRYGLDHCLAINATYLPTPDHAKQNVKRGLRTAWATKRAFWKSIWSGREYTPAQTLPRERDVCANDPLRCLTIGADGSLSPCIFLQLPLKSQPPQHPPLLVLGNIFQESIEAIWNSPTYQDFRRAFAIRRQLSDELYEEILNSDDQKQKTLEAPDLIKRIFAENPVPVVCRQCAKMQGL